MIDWSQERFEEIKGIVSEFLKHLGFKKESVYFIPISGLEGDNLMERSKIPALTSWYDGPCLVEVLD
jgi:elongation factor 1 alpha-like protein